jgi:hypothetical protein
MKLKTKISPKSLSRLGNTSIATPSNSYVVVFNSHAKHKNNMVKKEI